MLLFSSLFGNPSRLRKTEPQKSAGGAASWKVAKLWRVVLLNIWLMLMFATRVRFWISGNTALTPKGAIPSLLVTGPELNPFHRMCVTGSGQISEELNSLGDSALCNRIRNLVAKIRAVSSNCDASNVKWLSTLPNFAFLFVRCFAWSTFWHKGCPKNTSTLIDRRFSFGCNFRPLVFQVWYDY